MKVIGFKKTEEQAIDLKNKTAQDLTAMGEQVLSFKVNHRLAPSNLWVVESEVVYSPEFQKELDSMFN